MVVRVMVMSVVVPMVRVVRVMMMSVGVVTMMVVVVMVVSQLVRCVGVCDRVPVVGLYVYQLDFVVWVLEVQLFFLKTLEE